MILEPIHRPLPKPREMASNVNKHNVVNALVAFLFCITGPLAILLGVSAQGGLSQTDITTWIFSGYTFGGLFSILFCLFFRQPIGMAWTIPGAVLLGGALDHLSFQEVIGSYLVTGVVIGLLGITGWIKKGMDLIPMPIVMGMVAGVFLPLGLDIIMAFHEIFWIALATLLTFVALSIPSALSRIIPPVLGSVVAGVAAAWLLGQFEVQHPLAFTVVQPVFYIPQFSWQALLELVIPLSVTVIGIQNAQGIGVLRAAGHEPPVNAMTFACGGGSLLFGLFGSVPTCVTGPVNAILSSSGPKEHRYIGGVIFGLLIMLFGIFSPLTMALAMALPMAFIGMLGGLAMLRVLQGSFVEAFSTSFPLGALATFLITISNITIFNIGSPFWGLVFGFAVSWLLERGDFRELRRQDAISSGER